MVVRNRYEDDSRSADGDLVLPRRVGRDHGVLIRDDDVRQAALRAVPGAVAIHVGEDHAADGRLAAGLRRENGRRDNAQCQLQ